jgi:hypothetical protein
MPEQSHDTGLSREVEPIEAPTGEVVERSEPIVVLHAENSLERLTQRHSSQHSHLQVFRKLVSWTEPHVDSPLAIGDRADLDAQPSFASRKLNQTGLDADASICVVRLHRRLRARDRPRLTSSPSGCTGRCSVGSTAWTFVSMPRCHSTKACRTAHSLTGFRVAT